MATSNHGAQPRPYYWSTIGDGMTALRTGAASLRADNPDAAAGAGSRRIRLPLPRPDRVSTLDLCVPKVRTRAGRSAHSSLS